MSLSTIVVALNAQLLRRVRLTPDPRLSEHSGVSVAEGAPETPALA